MRVGYIGSSNISNFHIPALKNNGFQIGAIGTTENSERCLKLAEKYFLSNQFCNGGWREVIDCELDAFIICVKVKETLKILEKALETGKPIFVEKPIDFHVENIEKIRSHKNIKKVFVGYNRRFYKTSNELKNLCNSSEGGTITVNIPDSGYGIQSIISNGCHIIDLLRYLIGDFKIINKVVQTNNTKNDIEYFSALCSNKKWTILINAHSLKPSNFSISINSDNNVFELKPIECLTVYEGMNVIEPTKSIPIRQYLPNAKYSIFEDAKFKPGFDNMYKNFRLFVNNQDSTYCDFEDAYFTLKKCWEFIGIDISKTFVFK